MRNPHDPRFKKITRLHQTGEMIGTDRPVGRVTWTKTPVRTVHALKKGEGTLRYINKRDEGEWEMVTVKSIDIDRSIGQDAATCTIVLWNIHGDAYSKPQGDYDTEGTVGYYTAGRGQPTNPHLPTRSRHTNSQVYRSDNANDVAYPTNWGYPANTWRDILIPNTILKTYQGYGSDNFDDSGEHYGLMSPGYVAPKDDKQLYQTGAWLIDKVTYNTDATISIECRDYAKLLIEQIIYPPLIPMNRFPLVYHPAKKASGHKEHLGRNVATFAASSADRRFGANAPILGHRGRDAFDTKPSTFWLSPSNSDRDATEWLQAHTSGPINELRLRTVGGDYIAYVSVYENESWQGSGAVPGSGEADSDEGFRYVITTGDTLWDLAGQYYGNNLLWPRIAAVNDNIADPHWIYPGQRIKIPYISGTKNPPPAGASPKNALKYVKRITVPASASTKDLVVKLPRTYKASRLRITFTHLQKIVDGHYRVGVRHLQARNHQANTYKASTVNKSGYIADWSEAVKELCAWGGFTWPDARPNAADPLLGWTEPVMSYYSIKRGETGSRPSHPSTPMRVWGDFEVLGAGPVVSTPPDYFMNKSFMEGIREIVDFIGGIFYVDESGGAQFRLTNIWSGGNFIDDPDAPPSIGARIKDHPIEFHENANLTSYSVVIDDSSLRSEIRVVGAYPTGTTSAVPVAGGYVAGYNPVTRTTSAIDFTDILAGQYRLMAVPGDSTNLFKTERECQRMAELTALFILFTYRQGNVTAPAHPGLQIDDQVRIYERITDERNVHYVSGITSHQDLETGEYTMNLTTHWLGGDPNTEWFANKAQLTPAVKNLKAIIRRIGKSDTGDTTLTGTGGLL